MAKTFEVSRPYVPPEEAAHALTFMQWPSSRKVYRERWALKEAQDAILRIANAIADFEPVVMLADAGLHAKVRPQLAQNVTLWDVPTDDLWCRDSGPLFAWHNRALCVSHIQFNGWGGKQVHGSDALVAARVAERLGLDLLPSGLSGEAGGVEHDGQGLLMAHASSWLGRSRNPGLSRNDIGARLLRAYGADQIIWSDGVAGLDITDYHIDSLARFTGAGRVLMNLPQVPDPEDPFHQAALRTHDRLLGAGLTVDVIAEPEAPRVRDLDFVASYANYYVCNGAVIAAQFGDAEYDAAAARALAKHFPDRAIVQLEVDALGYLGGGIHCATQQMPQT
ncbi:agmatine deiminase family protein [Cognatishimia sp. SS12]|nr:agmatine deiminase family protein [Cognatishimia sp. SS12]MDC0736960.1 agmatine deiminase family protein [Cognatishimia sp. SS12]